MKADATRLGDWLAFRAISKAFAARAIAPVGSLRLRRIRECTIKALHCHRSLQILRDMAKTSLMLASASSYCPSWHQAIASSYPVLALKVSWLFFVKTS